MRIFYILVAFISLQGCESHKTIGVNELSINDTKYISNPSDIQILDTLVNIGKIEQGEKKKVQFRFKNIGKTDLLIMDVKPSCGCTIADFPKQPFKPGEEGVVTAEFNSAGKLGLFSKGVEIFSTTIPASHIVRIEGEIFIKK